MLAVCFALTASACGDGGAVITDGTKTEGAADGLRTLGIHRTMPESLVKALEGLRPAWGIQ